MMKDKPVRVGIIGTGGIARSHAARMRQEAGALLAACCDLSGKAARAFAAQHDIPAAYDDAQTMLKKEDLDAVVVSAPDSAHCPLSLAALRRGLHVLCEKPMAVTPAQARKMQRAAARAGVVAMINFSYREMPGVDQAHDFIAKGRLGRIMHVEASYLQCWLPVPVWGDWRRKQRFLWRLSRNHGGGALNDIGCHVLDLVTYLVGPVREVSCHTQTFDKRMPRNTCRGYTLDADDSFVATTRFDCGAFGVVHASRWATGHSNDMRVRVFGDRGALCVETAAPDATLRVCLDRFHTRHKLWSTVPTDSHPLTIQQRFLLAIRNKRPQPPTFDDGAANQALLHACHRSALEAKTIRLRRPSNGTRLRRSP